MQHESVVKICLQSCQTVVNVRGVSADLEQLKAALSYPCKNLLFFDNAGNCLTDNTLLASRGLFYAIGVICWQQITEYNALKLHEKRRVGNAVEKGISIQKEWCRVGEYDLSDPKLDYLQNSIIKELHRVFNESVSSFCNHKCGHTILSSFDYQDFISDFPEAGSPEVGDSALISRVREEATACQSSPGKSECPALMAAVIDAVTPEVTRTNACFVDSVAQLLQRLLELVRILTDQDCMSYNHDHNNTWIRQVNCALESCRRIITKKVFAAPEENCIREESLRCCSEVFELTFCVQLSFR